MRIAATLVLLLAGFAAGATVADARPPDVEGWRAARWGMDTAELDAAFGDALLPLPARRDYGDAYADRYLPEVRLGGAGFRAFFQMNAADGRLQQVLLEPLARGQPATRFAAVRDAVEAAYGPPDAHCDADDIAVPVSLALSWRFATTSIHLVYFDFVSSGIIYEQQSRHGDRLGVDTLRDTGDAIAGADARTMPRGVRVRYHATARTDLAPPGCPRPTDGPVPRRKPRTDP